MDQNTVTRIFALLYALQADVTTVKKSLEDNSTSSTSNATLNSSTISIEDNITLTAKARVLLRINDLDENAIISNLHPILEEIRAIYCADQPIECIEYVKLNSILNGLFVKKQERGIVNPARKIFLSFLHDVVEVIVPKTELVSKITPHGSFVNKDVCDRLSNEIFRILFNSKEYPMVIEGRNILSSNDYPTLSKILRQEINLPEQMEFKASFQGLY